MEIIHENIRKDYTIKTKNQIHNGVNHWHQRVELLYILRGSYRISIGPKWYVGSQGDMFVIHSGEIHLVKSLSEDCAIYICTFNPILLQSIRSEISYIRSMIPFPLLQAEGIADEIRQLLDEIAAELSARGSWYDVIVRADILRIYSLLVRHFEREALPAQKDSAKFAVFQQVLSYISEAYAGDITLNHIAERLGYSPAHVSTMFVTYTGMNFKTYLDSIRVHKASELLNNEMIKISDIANQCGFSSIRTFNNTFRRVTGTSPRQFRSNQL